MNNNLLKNLINEDTILIKIISFLAECQSIVKFYSSQYNRRIMNRMIGIRYTRFAFSMNLTAESFPALLMLNNAPVFGLELWRWSLAMCGLMISSSTGMPLCFRNDLRATQIEAKTIWRQTKMD